MSHVLRVVRFVATLGIAAGVAVGGLTHGSAQPARVLPTDMRATLDENDTPAQRDLAKKRRRTTDTRRPGDAPVYGIASGAGNPGFVSSPRRKSKSKAKRAPRRDPNDPLPLGGTPASAGSAPPPLRPVQDSSRRARLRAGAQASAQASA